MVLHWYQHGRETSNHKLVEEITWKTTNCELSLQAVAPRRQLPYPRLGSDHRVTI